MRESVNVRDKLYEDTQGYSKVGMRQQQGETGVSSTCKQKNWIPSSLPSSPPPKSSPSPAATLVPVVPTPSSTPSRSRSSSRRARSIKKKLRVSQEHATRWEQPKPATEHETKSHHRGLPKLLQALRPRSAQHKLKGSSGDSKTHPSGFLAPASSHSSHRSTNSLSSTAASSQLSMASPFHTRALSHPQDQDLSQVQTRVQASRSKPRPLLVRSHSAPNLRREHQQSSAPSSSSERYQSVGADDEAQMVAGAPFEGYRFPPVAQRVPFLESAPQAPALSPASALPVPISPLMLPAARSPVIYKQTSPHDTSQDILKSAVFSRIGGRRNSFNSFSQSSLALSDELALLPDSIKSNTTKSTGSSSGDSRPPSLASSEADSLISAQLPFGPGGPVLKSKFSDWTLSTHHSSFLSSSSLDNLSNTSLAASPSLTSDSRRSSAMESLLSPSSRSTLTRSIAVQTDTPTCPDCDTYPNSWGDEETARGPRLGGGRWSVAPTSSGGGEIHSSGEELSIREALAAFEDGCARAELRKRLLEAGLDGKGGWGGGGGSAVRGHEEMACEAREESVRLLEDEMEWRIESFKRAGDIIARL